MNKIQLLFFFLFLSATVFAQSKSYKRGVAYGQHSAADMAKASENISWWYNWAGQPEYAIRNTYGNYEVDFTPMTWNSAGISGVKTWADKDTLVKYLLGFNEPNFKDQANMTPTQAANAWPALQKIATDNNLKIVSPAVNYCGTCVSEGGTTYNNPFTYLDHFLAKCTDCQVDFIGLHWYGSGASIVGYVNTARKYDKPIWVTEFASWDYSNPVKTVEDQKKYLAGTVNFLERDSMVYRYSWFIGRTSGGVSAFPYIDLYGANGMLTPLGQLYMDIPVYDPSARFAIPGRIEAEEYYRMSGLFAEPTSDTEGFLNIGWTEKNDWAEYKITVDKSGTYNLNARVAGTAAGAIEFLIDKTLKLTLTTPNTGSWQNWRTVSKDIELEAGDHVLKMNVKTAGFNINWIEISNPTYADRGMEVIESVVYPNPVTDGIINVELKGVIAGGDYSCELFDLQGKKVLQTEVFPDRVMFQININAKQKLPAGLYYLHISGENSVASHKILVK
ncbi:MAG: glycosyl hydrolase [Draconibacterium sp.]